LAAALEALAALFDAARARELAGRALAQAGDGDRAALELEHAAAAFDSFARSDTATRQSASYESSAGRSIVERARARPTARPCSG